MRLGVRRATLPLLALGSALVAFLVLAPASVRALEAAGRSVTFRAADGRLLTGLFVEAAERPSPAVVLVPMLGGRKEDWLATAARLAGARIAALMIDLPGSTLPGSSAALVKWHADVAAAVAYVAGRPDVRPGSIGIAGASLGANLAVLAAAADPRVRSLALVSPSLDYRGVRIEGPMRQYGERPALLVASLEDPFAARTVRELANEPPGPRETRWAQAKAHGLVLLAREPDLVRAVVEWFQRTLG